MSATRRSTAGPGGLSSNALSSSRKSGLGGAAAPASARRTAGGSTENGSGLIVTRGLQAILDNDRRHRKVEEPNPAQKASKNGKAGRRSSGQAPNFVMCYLCGRQFGTSSIDIHRPQCYLKKMIEWERGEPAVRGPKPMSPEAHEKMMKERVASATAAAGGASVGHPGAARLAGSAQSRRANEIELYNQIQMDAYNETALAPCPNCGRTFLPDRLQVHLRSCKPGNAARPVHRVSAANAPANGAAAVPAAAATNGIAKSAAAAGAAPPQLASKAAPRGAAAERPIRASGAYAAASGAGPDDAPPRSAGSENTAIRARGSYALPEDAGADSVPPQAPSAKKPSRGPSLSNAYAAQQQHGLSEEPEPHDIVFDVESEEVKPPSPRADTERRLSSVAILRGDPDMTGSSAPNRPASMELSTVLMSHHSRSPDEERGEAMHSTYSLSQSRGREHAAGSRPRKQGSAGAPRTAQMPELVSERPFAEEGEEEVVEMRSDDEEDAQVDVSHSGLGSTVVVECAPDSDDDVQHVASDRKKWAPKKIPLNNVSRFKNVESRLKQQRTAELSMFVPCQYCGRTFVPERVKRHEECCSERNKPPSRRSIQLKTRPSSASAATTPRPAKAAPASAVAVAAPQHSTAAPSKVSSPSPARPSTAPAANHAAAAPSSPAAAPASGPGKAKFCGGCGVPVSSNSQKFCTECGFKL